jgi:hypothetical protein
VGTSAPAVRTTTSSTSPLRLTVVFPSSRTTRWSSLSTRRTPSASRGPSAPSYPPGTRPPLERLSAVGERHVHDRAAGVHEQDPLEADLAGRVVEAVRRDRLHRAEPLAPGPGRQPRGDQLRLARVERRLVQEGHVPTLGLRYATYPSALSGSVSACRCTTFHSPSSRR